jgi:uncharacterized protein (DUF952 family)
MLIYKLLRGPEWAALDSAGETAGASIDVADGFVHFSTAAQLPGTLARHFAGERGLWLLAVDADAAGADLAWEPSRGGALFPHLYRPLRRGDLVSAQRLAEGPDGAVLPDELA